MDALLALITFGFVAYFLVWKDWLQPLLGLDRPKPVKSLPPLPAYKSRSRRSARSNPVNAGSAHQDKVQPPANVQPNVQGSAEIAAHVATPGGADGAIAVTPNELQQLGDALVLRAKGATVEECLRGAFGVRKGGSEGYRRAKELFDAATRPPTPAQ